MSISHRRTNLFSREWWQVYYGFTAKFVAWAKTNVSLFDEWMAEMTTLLNQEGVLLKGEGVSNLSLLAIAE